MLEEEEETKGVVGETEMSESSSCIVPLVFSKDRECRWKIRRLVRTEGNNEKQFFLCESHLAGSIPW